MSTSLPARWTLEMRTVPAFRTELLLMNVPWKLVVPAFLNQNFSRLHGAVEGLAGWRGGFVKFDEAGRRRAEAALWRAAKAEGGRGVRGDVGPCAGHTRSAGNR